MNKTFVTLIVLVLIVIIGGIFLLGDRTEEPEILVTEDNMGGDDIEPVEPAEGVYTASAEESTVEWTGRKTFVDGYEDHGTLEIESGTLTVGAEGDVSGTITADMSTIAATEVSGPLSPDRLTGHLKSDDFFGVETYPEATFEVTGLTRGVLAGNLTVKGTTHPLSVPVEVENLEDGLRLRGKVDVDRTLYDVRFGSDSFFDNLGDNTIDDNFTLDLVLVFKAAIMEDGVMEDEA